jgi:two-component system, LuxR family, response regulator FixJ
MTQPNSTDGRQATVIVIDDDSSVLRALARLIRAAGYNVRTFSQPSALLADDSLPTYDACMVVDVNLPEMNGVDLCEVLVRRGRGLPVILITGQNDAPTKALIGRASAAVLYKPCGESLLLPAISRALKTAGK